MIANEQIKQIDEQIKAAQPTKPKYIHYQKEDLMAKFTRFTTLDGKTFNGKNYMRINLDAVELADYEGNDDIRIKFDGITAAYAPDANGDLSIVITLKSPVDNYNKRIGRGMAGAALLSYNERTQKNTHWSLFNPYGYITFAITVYRHDIIEVDTFPFPHFVLQDLSVADLRNSLLMQIVDREVEAFIGRYLDNFSGR